MINTHALLGVIISGNVGQLGDEEWKTFTVTNTSHPFGFG